MPTNANNRNASAQRQPSEWDNRKLGCMWRREKKGSGEKYLTGVLDLDKLKELAATATDDVQWVAFSNKHKQEDRHPDIIIYLSEKKDGSGGATKTAKAPAQKSAPAPAQAAPAADPNANDLI